MSQKAKVSQAADAAYGRALLCSRGGWSLREMLGADYRKFSITVEAPPEESTFQELAKKVSRRIRSSRSPKKKK